MKRSLLAIALVASSYSAFAGGVAAITTPTAATNYTVCSATVAGTGKTDVWGGRGGNVTANPIATFTLQVCGSVLKQYGCRLNF